LRCGLRVSRALTLPSSLSPFSGKIPEVDWSAPTGKVCLSKEKKIWKSLLTLQTSSGGQGSITVSKRVYLPANATCSSISSLLFPLPANATFSAGLTSLFRVPLI